ncbi:hypothetical protein ABGT15_02965 [Flavobacterium enshiense]|uniref:hypothetical protein n=1 Tax=Flavobacterium enshiense TaxID=1341165 RepID=UPI00345D189E
MNNSFNIVENKRLVGILSVVAILLLIPLIAMQFSSEVNWSASDFLIAGILLLGTGLTCELVLQKVKDFNYRILLLGIILLALIIIWIEMAVGIFGSPISGS